MLKHISLAAVLVCAAVPVTAQSAPAAADGQSLDPNRKICERIEVTGSRVKARKVCKTAAEWEELRRDSREELERAQQKHTGVPKSG